MQLKHFFRPDDANNYKKFKKIDIFKPIDYDSKVYLCDKCIKIRLKHQKSVITGSRQG